MLKNVDLSPREALQLRMLLEEFLLQGPAREAMQEWDEAFTPQESDALAEKLLKQL